MGKRRWRDYRHGNYRLRFFQGEGCAVWYEGGRRHRYRLGVTEEIAARSALDAFARRREQLARSGRETVGDLWALYRADRATDGKQMAAFDYNWQALAPRFAKIPPAVVDAALCRAYAAERIEQGRSQGTVWSELTRLRSCLNWAARNHKTDARFTVWVPSKPRPAKRVLTPDEAAALLDACTTPHVRLFVILALATGGREAAICELTWDRVDFERQTIDLRTGVVGNPLQKVQRKGRAQVHMSAADDRPANWRCGQPAAESAAQGAGAGAHVRVGAGGPHGGQRRRPVRPRDRVGALSERPRHRPKAAGVRH